MNRPIRPVVAFVLRLWREPSAQEGDAGWRGLIRPLSAAAETGENDVPFHSLNNLLAALRPLLPDEESPAKS